MGQEKTVEGDGYIRYLACGNGFTNCALKICSLLYVNYTPIKPFKEKRCPKDLWQNKQVKTPE